MSVDARSVTFAGYGAASVGYSTSAGGSSVIVSVAAQSAQTQSNIQAIYDGATSISTGTIRFTNANGVSFSINGQTLSASVAAQSTQTQNCVDVTIGGNSTSAGGGYALVSSGTLFLAGGPNITLSQNGQSVSISAGAGGGGSVTFSAGGASAGINSVVFSNSNGVSFGLNGSTITGSVATQTNQTLGLYATGNTTNNTSATFDARTLGTWNALGAATLGFSNGSVQVSVPQTSSLSATGWVSLSTNASTISIGATYTANLYASSNTLGTSSGTVDPRTISIAGAGAVSVGANNSGWVVSAPIMTASVSEPFPILTGTAYSSHAPASWWFNRVVLPDPLAISNINVAKSLSVAVFVPAAASSGTQKYSYSHGITIFSRQDYAANSSNLTTVTTASFGMTGSLSVTVSSVSAALSFVTNSTGGTTSQSTTFNGASFASWSNYFSGPFVLGIPCVTTLLPGEYFFAHNHSSTAATGGNAIFAGSTNLLSVSNLHVAPQVVGPLQTLGQSITQASLAPWGMGGGIASAVTTSSSMAGSVVSAATQNNWYICLSNA